jgi:hypothetical protein
MGTMFKAYEYGRDAVNGEGKHDFQSTGNTYVLQHVYMGACCEDVVDEYLCTKCGLDSNYHQGRRNDCPVE